MNQIKSSSGAKCPICKNLAVPQDFPFCSDRCRKVDLHRWLSGTYVIPGGGAENGEDKGDIPTEYLEEEE